jgi:predicted nucleic acid-binding Zn finger protein
MIIKNKMKKENTEKHIKKYTTLKKKSKKKIKKKTIMHLKINKKDDNSLFNYDGENPDPYEPKILENNLCNFSSVIESVYSNSHDENIEREQVHMKKEQIVINLMSDFIKGIGGSWPNKTNIYCYWCCHPFDNIPCGIPEKYIDGVFYLSECFCSFNCTASYIFNITKHKKWEKYSLLNLLYKKISNKNEKIELALNRKLLNVFGGYMNISEFRKNLDILDKKHNLLIPPIVSIIPKVEVLRNNCVINNYNNNTLFDNTLNDNKKNKINTLTNYMNIKNK